MSHCSHCGALIWRRGYRDRYELLCGVCCTRHAPWAKRRVVEVTP